MLSRSNASIAVLLILAAGYIGLPYLKAATAIPADGNQNECLQTNRPGDPDLTPRPNPGVVRVIDLTDDGMLVHRCQITDAAYEFRRRSQDYGYPEIRKDVRDLPRLAVLYIHGWQHSSSPDDRDLSGFKEFIASLQERLNDQKIVFGIYVAWNADAGLGELDDITFWSKKEIADRISISGMVTKIIAMLGNSRSSSNGIQDDFIVMGHSFGARILYSAIEQTLISDTARQYPTDESATYKVVPALTDAAILLNPAFEASRFTGLESFSREKERFSEKQLPILISISTNADDATRLLFPIGQWIGGARSKAELTTLGNYSRFQTHTLKATNRADCQSGYSDSDSMTEVFYADGLCLTRDKPQSTDSSDTSRQPHNPYIVTTTDRSIISGHNDIWENAPFKKWIVSFVLQLDALHNKQ